MRQTVKDTSKRKREGKEKLTRRDERKALSCEAETAHPGEHCGEDLKALGSSLNLGKAGI